MKKKIKLELNKEVIASLSNDEMNQARGGMNPNEYTEGAGCTNATVQGVCQTLNCTMNGLECMNTSIACPKESNGECVVPEDTLYAGCSAYTCECIIRDTDGCLVPPTF